MTQINPLSGLTFQSGYRLIDGSQLNQMLTAINASYIWPGNIYYCNPATGHDYNDGLTANTPVATLYKAHQKMTSGNNDVCLLVSNGATSGTARLSTALAKTVTSSATAGTLNWTKSACHLIGVGAPSLNNRARIAPPSGTYTVTTFGSGNFIVNSGSGNIFSNFSVFNGFSTGGAAQIAWTDTGSRNYYSNCDFLGLEDAGSANDTASYSVLLSGAQESVFDSCGIGSDTTARTAANASLNIASASARLTFRRCVFPSYLTGGGTGAVAINIASAGLDRFVLLDSCQFLAFGSTMAAVIKNAGGSPAGNVLLTPSCLSVGATAIATTGAVYGPIGALGATTWGIAGALT